LKKLVYACAILLTCALLASLTQKDDAAGLVDVKHYWDACLDSLGAWEKEITILADTGSRSELEQSFLRGRMLYKHIEFLSEYYFPVSANKINGAPILEAEASQNLEPVYPTGFQVMEPYIYGDLDKGGRDQVRFEASNIGNAARRIQKRLPDVAITATAALDALKLGVYTLMIKGISGFDAPEARSGIIECHAVFSGALALVQSLPDPDSMTAAIRSCDKFVTANFTDFNSFNRALFIKDYCNRLTRSITDYQVKRHIPFIRSSRAVNPRAGTIFAPDAFDPLFFAPDGTSTPAAAVALGKKLFYDKGLSFNNGRSCASCHIPDKAFSDGMAKNESLSGETKLLRNTPSLINAALQPAQFYDSRTSFLEDQIHDVITNRNEMHGDPDEIIQRLLSEKTYGNLFAKAYPKEKIGNIHLKKAIAAYIRSLTAMNSAFDRYMNGDSKAITVKQLDGFNLFMGKARCGTCHFMPLFNGAHPPLYFKMESEVLGVPARNDTVNATVDTDKGKYLLYKIPHQMYAFKTVTVRNTALTSPYMHNGIFTTLEEVVDFYNRGGGAGIGIELDNQTLAPERLELTAYEKSALVDFLKALTDTAISE